MNDPHVPRPGKGALNGGNPFVSYGWLSVYYREAATAEFHTQGTPEARFFATVVPDPNDGIRQRAGDRIPEKERSPALSWLQLRELGGR
jgi:hypothetical protein